MLPSNFRSLDSRLKYITKKTAPPATAIKQTITTIAIEPLLIPEVSGGRYKVVVVPGFGLLFDVVGVVLDVVDFVEAVVLITSFVVDFVGMGVVIWTERKRG